MKFTLAWLKEHLDTLGYSYREETDNPAYKLFLGVEA